MELDHDVQMEDVGDELALGMNDDMQISTFPNMSIINRHPPGELTSQSLNQLDAWIETLSQCRPLTEEEVETLCNMVSRAETAPPTAFLTISHRQKNCCNTKKMSSP